MTIKQLEMLKETLPQLLSLPHGSILVATIRELIEFYDNYDGTIEPDRDFTPPYEP